MKKRYFIITRIVIGVLVTMLLSCDDIYDEPSDMPLPWPSAEQSFSMVNCTSYQTWTYFNLHEKDSITLNYNETEIPINWDISIHRYDIKTNDAKAIETNYSSLELLKADISQGTFQMPSEDQWKADIDGRISIDMSQMMTGNIVYYDSKVNTELSKWLQVDTSAMPPIYTPSEKVYLIRFADNTICAILFTGFSNPNKGNIKGYISFDYEYPLF